MYPQMDRDPTRDEAPPEPSDLECMADLPRRVLCTKYRVKPELGSVTIGVGGATLAAGAVLFGLGRKDNNSVENAPEGTTFSEVQAAADRAPTRTKTGIALMSVGAATCIGGMIWQLVGGHEEEIPEISIGPTGVSIRGKF